MSFAAWKILRRLPRSLLLVILLLCIRCGSVRLTGIPENGSRRALGHLSSTAGTVYTLVHSLPVTLSNHTILTGQP